MQVLATDGFFTAVTHVTIDILDDNDNPPYCSQHRYHELISESTATGTFIIRVKATDADEGANAKMRSATSHFIILSLVIRAIQLLQSY